MIDRLEHFLFWVIMIEIAIISGFAITIAYAFSVNLSDLHMAAVRNCVELNTVARRIVCLV